MVPTHGREPLLNGETRQPDKSEPQNVSSSYAKAAKYLALGFELPSTIVGSLILGYFLDEQFGTEPWLMVVCAVLGFAGAVVRLVQYLRYFSKKAI
jgi:F0F1-type ATP synthase assembly protein I